MVVAEQIEFAPGIKKDKGCRQPQLEQAVRHACLTAVLLTGNRERAEATVMESIRLWDTCEPLALNWEAIKASLAGGYEAIGSITNLRNVLSIVPHELRGVLDLPESLRKCYVLRVLNGFSRKACAELLQLTPSEIDVHTCAALQSLSQQ